MGDDDDGNACRTFESFEAELVLHQTGVLIGGRHLARRRHARSSLLWWLLL